MTSEIDADDTSSECSFDTSPTTVSTVADSNGCINDSNYQTTHGEAVFSILCYTDWPAGSSANSNIVTDLMISKNIANMRDYLELCAQYNSNFTATSSTARRCRAAVYVSSVDESLTSECGSKRTSVASRIGLMLMSQVAIKWLMLRFCRLSDCPDAAGYGKECQTRLQWPQHHP